MATEADFIQEYVSSLSKTKICQEHIAKARANWAAKKSKANTTKKNTNTKKVENHAVALNADREKFLAKATQNAKALGLPEKETAWAQEMEKRFPEKPKAVTGLFSGPAVLYTTVEKLDAYIGEKMKDYLKTEAETGVEGPVSDTISAFCEGDLNDFKKEVCSWTRMKTSGNQFDCLIHSFLTMVSPNFRRLPSEQKNKVADAFRRTLFLKFPAIETQSDKKGIKKRIPAKYVFLTDSEIQVLTATYKVNLIVFEQENSTITAFDTVKDSNTFYMLSNRALHYEAVKKKDGYTLTRDLMNLLLEQFPQKFTGDVKPICKFPGTDVDIIAGETVVKIGDEAFAVTELLYDGDPPTCNKLKVKSLETDEEQTVDIGSVAQMTGGRRKTRRSRRRTKA